MLIPIFCTFFAQGNVSKSMTSAVSWNFRCLPKSLLPTSIAALVSDLSICLERQHTFFIMTLCVNHHWAFLLNLSLLSWCWYGRSAFFGDTTILMRRKRPDIFFSSLQFHVRYTEFIVDWMLFCPKSVKGLHCRTKPVYLQCPLRLFWSMFLSSIYSWKNNSWKLVLLIQ